MRNTGAVGTINWWQGRVIPESFTVGKMFNIGRTEEKRGCLQSKVPQLGLDTYGLLISQ